jgi:endonuclease III
MRITSETNRRKILKSKDARRSDIAVGMVNALMAQEKRNLNSNSKATTANQPVKARVVTDAEPVALNKRAGKTQMPPAPERVAAILAELRKAYPDVVCALNHKNAWELTVATILSAQCTDVRVNLVTPALFKAFPTPKAMAAASLPELEELIRTTGFFRNKAKSIKGAGRVVTEEFGGKVPQTMEEILRLPGVARKTGNVVLGSWYGIAVGVVVDTHVMRLSRRLELTKETSPEKVERDLVKIIPQDRWIAFSHELIHHGRQVCVARKPKCVDCTLERLCNSSDKTWSSH